jgi:hypothetical protein
MAESNPTDDDLRAASVLVLRDTPRGWQMAIDIPHSPDDPALWPTHRSPRITVDVDSTNAAAIDEWCNRVANLYRPKRE